MRGLGERLKERATALGLSSAEVARRAGLDVSRYGHYVRGRNNPDLATLVRLARVLDTTPHALMGLNDDGTDHQSNERPATDPRRGLTDRLLAAADTLDDQALTTLVRLSETFADTQKG